MPVTPVDGPSPDDWLQLPDAARLARLTVSALRQAIFDGKLPAIKSASGWRVRRADLMAYAEEQRDRSDREE